MPKVSQNLIFHVKTSFIRVLISLKTSNWEAAGMHCVYLVSIASSLLQNSGYRVAFKESGHTMTEESLREFLSGNQTKFETAKGSKNEKSIDLMEDKYDC